MKCKAIIWAGIGAFAVVCVAGCATAGKGSSDEELVKGLLTSWHQALLSKDTEKILATYAEEFSHDGDDYQAAGKTGLRTFIDECKTAGYFDGVEVDFDNAVTAIDGDTATISGIAYTNHQGTVTIELKAQKGKTGWLISDMSIEGL